MTARSPSAFLLSATLHGAVVAAILISAYVLKERPPETTKLFLLVAGAGDNYMATEAPALGSEDGGVKLDLPKPPTPKAEPARVEPVAPPEPAPLTAPPTPAPQPKKETAPPTPKAPAKERSMASNIKRQVVIADVKAKTQARKEREAEAKKIITKAEFDRQNAAKKVAAATPKGGSPSVKHVDTKGIAAGVKGGSTANTKGGAGGTELSVAERSELENYIALLLQRLRDELAERTATMDEGLKATASFRVQPDGRLVRGQITESSRNEAFDRAVLAAISAVRLPARVKGVPDDIEVPFSTQGLK